MIQLELTDGLGRVWNLSDIRSSPVLGRGVKGLGRPTMERVKGASSPALHGSRWAGWRATDRDVVLPVMFYGDSVSMIVRDFARGIVPEQPGGGAVGKATLTATLDDSTRWSVGLWLTDDGNLTATVDPDVRGGIEIPFSGAADVFWSGPEWSSSWKSDTPPANWLLTSGGVAALGSSHALSSATATNSGDVRVWPVWTVAGPCTSVSVGIGGHMVTLAATVVAGETVTIDTDPELGQMAMKGSTDITSSLTAVDFAPLEPGRDTPLQISMTGTGTVSMRFRPKRLAIL